MLRVLTDEESIAAAEDQIKRLSDALYYTCQSHPGTSLEALVQVLYMVNGQNWMGVTDISRAKVRAKSLGDETTYGGEDEP